MPSQRFLRKDVMLKNIFFAYLPCTDGLILPNFSNRPLVVTVVFVYSLKVLRSAQRS